MQRYAWSLACGLAIAIGLPGLSEAGWESDYETARAKAQQSGRPLLVHFYADWCGPCKQMEATVLSDDAVLEACGTKVVAVKVNFDHRKQLAKRLGVAALPTDVILSPEGEELGRYVGMASVEEYIARMDDALEQCGRCGKAGETRLPSHVAAVLTRLASDRGLGLEGYSPVSLTTDRVWVQGSPEFACRYAGVTYYMASQDELRRFQKNPAKYAPRFSGFDPLILSTDGVAVPGLIVYGSFYKGHLYLHATAECRKAFLEDPKAYPAPTELDVPEFLAKKRPVVAEIPAS